MAGSCKIYNLILTGLLVLGYCYAIAADDTPLFNNQNDTLIYPNYSYEHIPDYNYSEIEQQFFQIESEIPLSFNTRIKAFIDYFTIKDREYTKNVLGKLDLYFPLLF